MKALTYHAASDDFVVTQLDIPELETDYDVLVRVTAIGLNPVDAKIHLWKSLAFRMDDSFVPGLDVSGVIVALGNKVTGWNIGDSVLYHGNMRRSHGGLAEYAIHDARTLTRHPKVDSTIAAATPCAGWTAMRALVDRLAIEEQESIFIAGGSGGVGSFAIQLAKYYGVGKIITTCSEANHDFVRMLGATDAIDYRNANVVDRVLMLTNGLGVDVSLDCVGGDSDILCASVLGFEGQMVELVQPTRPERYPDAFLKGLTFHQLSLGSGHVNGPTGMNDIVETGERFNMLLEKGMITVPRIQVISLSQAGDALKQLRSQRTVGKIVVSLSR
ncbi:zinc-binding dehydrogenase [Vibrio hangzhouensis]|uniref:NADPH:quinone reductase n=1 Tax=Vibrio hangzhouensis TaxID=462991 RepID=A0A1H5WW11_9VIBR|nr:zinc-binding dehydrogenase [Vibrio hangzhouensis]SEG03147.1 NADPH:quinone reductase [Vibrio hangzhouensis]